MAGNKIHLNSFFSLQSVHLLNEKLYKSFLLYFILFYDSFYVRD